MITINENDYSNPCDKSNDKKTNIKEWITKILIEIIKILTNIMIIIVIIIIINNSNYENDVKLNIN